MTKTLRKTLLTAIAAGTFATAGPGLSPVQADPIVAEFLDDMIREVRDHRRDRRDLDHPWYWEDRDDHRQRGDRDYHRYRDNRVSRHRYDHDTYRDRRYHRHHRHYRPRHEQYSRGVRGLYLPGYDIEEVLRWNYSGHRH